MSAAAETFERRERADRRLLAHCELLGRLTAVDEEPVPVRARLEEALGPELTMTLLAARTSSP